MPISPNFSSIYTAEFEINFLQCYPNGHMKYTELCNIFQVAAGKHAELGGISFSDMQAFHQAWVLSRMRVEIKRLPKWKDILTVKTWIHSLEKSRSIRCMEIYLGNEKIVGIESFWAVFNTQTRRPEVLKLAHEHFKMYPNRANKTSFGKIEFQNHMNLLAKHTVKLSDVDIVNHVNSVKYLEWCLDLLECDTVLNKQVESLDMNYIKELSINKEASIYHSANSNKIQFQIKDSNKVNYALEINFK